MNICSESAPNYHVQRRRRQRRRGRRRGVLPQEWNILTFNILLFRAATVFFFISTIEIFIYVLRLICYHSQGWFSIKFFVKFPLSYISVLFWELGVRLYPSRYAICTWAFLTLCRSTWFPRGIYLYPWREYKVYILWISNNSRVDIHVCLSVYTSLRLSLCYNAN